MKRITMLAAGLITGGTLLFGSTMPAQALWVRPSSGPLTDASGATNGCTAEIAKLNIGPIQGAAKALRIEISAACPVSANAHRESVGLALYELMPDGSLRTVLGPSVFAKTSNTLDPITVGGGGQYLPCDYPGLDGTHTWVARATVKTKQSKTDTNPFIAKVHSVETLTC